MVTTITHYDGDDMVLVLANDSTGTLKNRYLHGEAVDEVLADENWQGVLWALPDQFQNVRDLVDHSGTLYNHIDYDTFGKATYEWKPASQGHRVHAYGFQSRERDQETQLNYHRNRYYNPSIGRWISEDPIGFEGGDYNLNRFVGNGPTNGTDPYGEQVRRRRFGARGMLYGELRRSGFGAAVDAAHQTHVQLQRDIETAARITPGLGDAISAIEIATGENAFHPGETLTSGQRAIEAGLMGLPNIIDLGGGILRHIFYHADDVGFGSGAARLVSGGPRLPTEGAKVVDPPALQHQATGGVYVLRDPETGKVMYAGRTKNLNSRRGDHARDPRFTDFEFDPIYPTDVYDEQRGLEQIVHDAHQPPFNRINPISSRNPNRPNYIGAGNQYIDDEWR
jgi:RHS repeat-associated protein